MADADGGMLKPKRSRAWGQALWAAGEREEARAKLRAAARMDLSAPDRARLRRIWAVAGRA